jgi:hypothetical protein
MMGSLSEVSVYFTWTLPVGPVCLSFSALLYWAGKDGLGKQGLGLG